VNGGAAKLLLSPESLTNRAVDERLATLEVGGPAAAAILEMASGFDFEFVWHPRLARQ